MKHFDDLCGAIGLLVEMDISAKVTFSNVSLFLSGVWTVYLGIVG
jgi:enamine deaminase RidA (YjgF/YER057c/UK114 family)